MLLSVNFIIFWTPYKLSGRFLKSFGAFVQQFLRVNALDLKSGSPRQKLWRIFKTNVKARGIWGVFWALDPTEKHVISEILKHRMGVSFSKFPIVEEK